MLIVDEGKAREHARMRVVERTRETTLTGAQNEARDAGWVADKEKSVANVERQSGKRLSPEAFMRKLRRVNRDITLEPHPGKFAPQDTTFYKMNHDKAVLYLNVGDQKVYLLVCEGDWMPEWTIFDTQKVRVPVDANRPEGIWQDVEIPWRKNKRGWREVLLMLIKKKLIGVDAVEREFGAGDRPSWKLLTGKGSVDSIF